MSTGWYCAFCNANHGPHVDTCPRQNVGRVMYVPLKAGGGEIAFDIVIPTTTSPEPSPSAKGQGSRVWLVAR